MVKLLIFFIPKVIHSSFPDQALLVAAGAVGHALGITICPPARSEDLLRLQNPLEVEAYAEQLLWSIARASRIRMRRLHLVDDWWKSDCGPMLAYTLEDSSPVALLPVKGDR